MEYYSAIKKNEIMPFAATQMDLQIIILSEVRQRNIVQYPLYSESKKKLYKWTYLQNGMGGSEEGYLWGEEGGVWDGHVYAAIFKMDNQQGPTV